MKINKRVVSMVLAFIVAGNVTIPVSASESSSSKEEVVYITTEADGSVESANVVNIFDGGSITDYGDYSAVKMLTTTDDITQTDDKITFTSTADKVYYQGTLENVEIPWNISIQYFLDGKEYQADEIAGKSGSLEIKISITQNSKCKTSFFDDYALQTTILLDTNLCNNIKSDGATVAEVGADKQLLYTILPGKGLDTSIYADVQNFEMDAISINGIKLNLNLEIDEEELTAKVQELMQATQKLNDGASELYSGTESLKTGSNALDSGIVTLESGVNTLDTGIKTLQTGMQSMQTGLNTLNNQSASLTNGSEQIKTALETIQDSLSNISVSSDKLEELTSASGNIKSGINNLFEGISTLRTNLNYTQYKAIMSQNGLDIDSLKTNNQAAIEECSSNISSLQTIIAELSQEGGHDSQIEQLNQQISSLQSVIQLLSGNSLSIDGTESYLNSVSEQVNNLYTGADTLNNEYETFNTAIAELAQTLTGFMEKLPELTSGINQLIANYENFDSGLSEYTDGVATIVASYNQILDGVSSLASGSKELLNGTETLSSKTSQFFDGITELCDGAKQLNNGTNELNSETEKMDEQLENQIDEILSSIQGDETEVQSFVSEKNQNIDNVQFVIKTKAIEQEKTEKVVSKEPEDTSLWKKFIQLFGF